MSYLTCAYHPVDFMLITQYEEYEGEKKTKNNFWEIAG